MKNIILKTIMTIIFFIFCYSACCLDSEQFWIPLAVTVVTGAILTLFAWVNGAFN